MSWTSLDFGECPDCDPKVMVVRTIDLFVMGPAMIWFAVAMPSPPKGSKLAKFMPALRLFMFVSGVGTSLFNGANLVRCLEQRDRERRRGLR